MTRPIMIMAGGTGGHVYPALAVATELQSRGIPVVWLGTRKGIESKLVPEAGIEIDWLSINGLRGKSILTLLLAPANLVIACLQIVRILFKRNPRAVLGMGGFVSGPGGLMAWIMRKPLLIHEQNAVPGLTNRLLSKIAGRVMEAFPHSFKTNYLLRSVLYVGNPVRQEIASIALPAQRLKNHQGRLRLLVFGGSLGAARLNEVVPQALSRLSETQRFEVRHQAGTKNIHQARMNYAKLNVTAKVDAYIDDMAEAYDWADLVLCRAGAMTISELAAAGVASILIPYPYAVDDHQTLNAHYLSDANAAILIQQDDFNAESLFKIISVITKEKIIEMAVRAKQLGMPEATRLVTDQCILAGGGCVN